MVAIKQRQTPERAGDGQIETLGETLHGGARRGAPSGAAENDERTLGRPDHLLQFGHLRLAGPRDGGLDAQGVRHAGAIVLHVLGQRDHHGAGTALHGGVKGARDEFGNARGVVDFNDPFGEGAIDGAIIHFLKGAALQRVALHLPDEQDDGR